MPYAGTSVSGAGAIPAQTTSSQNSFDSVMSIGSAIVTANNLNDIYNDYTDIKKMRKNTQNLKRVFPKLPPTPSPLMDFWTVVRILPRAFFQQTMLMTELIR